MNYYYILLLLILIQHNIILINEESLILFCTLNFFWLVIEFFSSFVKAEFNQQKLEIEKPIKNGLKRLILMLKNNSNLQNQSLVLYNNIKNLKTFCHVLIVNIVLWSNILVITNAKLKFLKRLQFISNMEKQVTKLVLALLLFKLKRITQVSYFFTHKINNQHFLRVYKVSMKESINLLIKR